jgi:hypothetical protein
MPSLQGIIQTSGVASHLLPTGHQPAAPAQPELARGAETGQGDNMLKIQYKEYDQKILCAELRPHGPGGAVRHSAGVQVCSAMCSAVQCNDGVQGRPDARQRSPARQPLAFLRQALHSVPRIDAFKTVILTEEISVSQIILLNKIIIDEQQTGPGQGLEPEQHKQLAMLGCSCLLSPGPAQGEAASASGVSCSLQLFKNPTGLWPNQHS